MHQLHQFLFCLAVTTLCLAHTPEGKRVVIIPMPFTSHTKYHTNVARALVDLGHEVWLTMPDCLVEKGVLDVSGFTVVRYKTNKDFEESAISAVRDSYFRGERDDWVTFFDVMKDFCDCTLKDHGFFQVIKDIHPDLVVIDNIVFMKMFSTIPYRLGTPFAFLGTHFDPVGQRIPFSPAVTPISLLPFNQHMTFLERVANTLLNLLFMCTDRTVYSDAVARYAPEMPYLPMDMLLLKAELWLIETDHILDYPKPSLPNIKFIGGTATGPAKPLPSEFKSFMDGATEGVVIVSFGSYVIGVPKQMGEKLLEVFLRLPMKVVFRSNLTSPDPAMIMMSPWIPQNDLLGHPNTKVFVSHCGKNGQYEALYHAVPIVATPMFGDQPYNAERARVKGFAETVDLRTVGVEELTATILKVAREPRYKAAITKASRLFRQQFGVPMQEAARWLDHVMEYGGGYMRSAGQDMPYYQFLLLDVIVFILGLVLLVVFLFCLFVYLICKCTCKGKLKEE